jgi:hypothetical protein
MDGLIIPFRLSVSEEALSAVAERAPCGWQPDAGSVRSCLWRMWMSGATAHFLI